MIDVIMVTREDMMIEEVIADAVKEVTDMTIEDLEVMIEDQDMNLPGTMILLDMTQGMNPGIVIALPHVLKEVPIVVHLVVVPSMHLKVLEISINIDLTSRNYINKDVSLYCMLLIVIKTFI